MIDSLVESRSTPVNHTKRDAEPSPTSSTKQTTFAARFRPNGLSLILVLNLFWAMKRNLRLALPLTACLNAARDCSCAPLRTALARGRNAGRPSMYPLTSGLLSLSNQMRSSLRRSDRIRNPRNRDARSTRLSTPHI